MAHWFKCERINGRLLRECDTLLSEIRMSHLLVTAGLLGAAPAAALLLVPVCELRLLSLLVAFNSFLLLSLCSLCSFFSFLSPSCSVTADTRPHTQQPHHQPGDGG